ncbi:glycerate kinase [[Limnothrix rosea] IAM M-220]|uniref:glycerate kinase n=1 Tax=[Limnothrix rosea] IAM M-220 TaxID=454133 RepID=UPI00095D8D9B|nr:glycerate kinase [[Limnothrix rosea] IAM M-220]OKH19973.1 glycerate kinase [[Limnothrix rosea] IAM M-220]
MDIAEILGEWLAGHPPQITDYEKLLAQEKQYPKQALGLGCDLSVAGISVRATEFLAIAPAIIQLCESMKFTDQDAILRTLWELWLPLAMQLRRARQQQDQPLIQGILGGQGTGKTTISRVLREILATWNYPCIAISIDDLYKTYAERQKLLETQPRLIWRGPPGTHDVDTGLEVLTQLQRANLDDKIAVPRFDKSLHNGQGDRLPSEEVDPAEIILFEGWFVGCRPVEPEVFKNAPAPINTSEDRQFAQEMNEALQDYLPLWEKLDRLIVLYPEDYRLSKEWRKDAEHNMIAKGKTGMSDAEIDDFVDYFWRSLHPELFITPLTQNPDWTDLVIEIDAEHRPCKIYRPKTSE